MMPRSVVTRSETRGIGPDCYAKRIKFIRTRAADGWPLERIVTLSGMPMAFVIEVLSEAKEKVSS
jgi:hypothetical protein